MPWAGGAAGKDAPGLEPISFDDLDELEQLLSSDEPSEPSGAPPPPVIVPPEPAEPESESTETEAEPAPAAPDAPANTIWRLKSSSGLTYSFYAVSSLLRWADGLGQQKGVLISSDGVTWKDFAKFRAALGPDGDGDPHAAFQGTVTARPAQAPAPKRSPSTTQTGTRESIAKSRRSTAGARSASAVRGQSKLSTTGERKRSPSVMSVTGERKSDPAASRAQNRGGGPRQKRTSSYQLRSADAAPSNPWPGRLVFMGLGVAIGGASVYFGMYLLGFYELQLPF